MRMLRFDADVARQIRPGLTGIGLLYADGVVNTGVLRVEAGAEIPRHPANPDQLFIVVSGRGEVCGGDGRWRPIEAGQAAVWAAGEEHTTRAVEPITAVVIEMTDLPVHPRSVPLDEPDRLVDSEGE